MCDRSNAQDLVQEMLAYLETADYTIREEMVDAPLFRTKYCHSSSFRYLKLQF